MLVELAGRWTIPLKNHEVPLHSNKVRQVLVEQRLANGLYHSPTIFLQVTTGCGKPSARQWKATLWSRVTFWSRGSMAHRGGTARQARAP